jgi:hypothetical protein
MDPAATEAPTETTAGAYPFSNFSNFGRDWELAGENLIVLIEQLIAALTKADPVRAQMAALSFKYPELRIVAQIAYARAQLQQAGEQKAKNEKKKPAK